MEPRAESQKKQKNIVMVRRIFATGFSALLFALCIFTVLFSPCSGLFAAYSSAWAQQPKKVPRIGFLSTTSFPLARVEAFRQGLRELGWVEGRNITVEHRHPERNFDQAAAELVRLSVDIIVTGGPTATRSAKEATTTIPIVFTGV